MLEAYLNILIESLQKKAKYLQELKNMSLCQNDYLTGENPDLEAFSNIVKDKELIIDELDKLDTGFDATFDKVKEELGDRKSEFAEQIKTIQNHIRTITDLGMEIEAQEARNKVAIEQMFSTQRRKYKSAMHSVNVARKYSNSMHNISIDDSRYIDSKK